MVQRGRHCSADRMLDALPPQWPLRGASTNAHDEIRRFFRLITGVAGRDVVDNLPWDRVDGMSLSGGFTQESSFEATLDLLLDGQPWSEEDAGALAEVLATSINSDTLPIAIEVVPRRDRVQFVFDIDDLPGLLRHRVALED